MKGLFLIVKALDYVEFEEKKEEFMEKLLQNYPKRVKLDEQMTFLQE
jgi:hypothetical protein